VVSRETGLPVGVFRLTNEEGQEIFDCQILESYGLRLGCTVYLETWDGWNELIPAAVSGITKQVDCKPTIDCSLHFIHLFIHSFIHLYLYKCSVIS